MSTAWNDGVTSFTGGSAERPEVAALLPPAAEDNPRAPGDPAPGDTWPSSGTTRGGPEADVPVPEVEQPPVEAPNPWPKPESPDGETVPGPWPWDCLPPAVADMGQAIATTMNVPDAMAGACALGVLSIAVSNRVGLRIKRDHICYGNLYFWVGTPVAAGKTPCLRPLTQPLLECEREAYLGYKEALANWRANEVIIAAKMKALKRAAGKAMMDDLQGIADEMMALEAGRTPQPGEPRLFIDDCTSEALARCLSQNGERLGVVSSEARKIFRVAGGRYSHSGGDYDIWVKAHAGDSVRVDRISRQQIALSSPCLSAVLLTQPDVFGWVGKDDEARQSGFLARFLYVVPDTAARSDYPTGSIPAAVDEAYRALVGATLRLLIPSDGNAPLRPLTAELTTAAYELWQRTYRDWNRDARAADSAGAPLLAGWCAKAREHTARLALLLAVGDTVTRQGSTKEPLEVGLAHMQHAIRLMNHLRGHATRAFQAMGETRMIRDATRAWAWMNRNRSDLARLRESEGAGRLEAVKPRDLITAGLAGCSSAEATNGVLEELADRGYLQRFEWRRPGVAARAHVVWYLRPAGVQTG